MNNLFKKIVMAALVLGFGCQSGATSAVQVDMPTFVVGFLGVFHVATVGTIATVLVLDEIKDRKEKANPELNLARLQTELEKIKESQQAKLEKVKVSGDEEIRLKEQQIAKVKQKLQTLTKSAPLQAAKA